MNAKHPAADPVAEALHFLRMSGVFYCRSEFTAPWGLELPAVKDQVNFHVVTDGRCWLDVPGEDPLRLETGDFVLVPHGKGHRLSDNRRTRALTLGQVPHRRISDRYGSLSFGGGGAAAHLICGAVKFEQPAARNLVALLPGIIHLRTRGLKRMEWLQSMLRFLAAEARELRPGGETVITRLADILVIQAIRSWLEQDPAARGGWLGALRDPKIGRALASMHRDPARGWTLELLAAEAAMSRSAFAARFTAIVGESAMQYMTRWRMRIAHQWLLEGNPGLAELAGRLGYQSEAAFSRAFKRVTGTSPGSVRRRTTPVADGQVDSTRSTESLGTYGDEGGVGFPSAERRGDASAGLE
jgi:AraC-like DNA-binding protein